MIPVFPIMPMNPLKGQRIALRPVEIGDLDAIYRWENDPGNWIHSNHLNPISRFYLEQYILNAENNIYVDKQLRLLIVDHNKKQLGIIDLFDFDPHHRRAAVGIIIDASVQKQGYGSEALNLLIQYANKTLNLKQLYCGIGEGNNISLRLFQNHGFRITGTKKEWRHLDGKWVDEHFLQLIFD